MAYRQIAAADLQPGMILVIGTGIAYRIETISNTPDALLVNCEWLHYPLFLNRNLMVEVIA